jgi:Flp pilus assembly pilin Flp
MPKIGSWLSVPSSNDEAGQGLVEYLLILALVAFACTAGMKILANGVNQAFSEIGSLVNAYVT